MRTDLHRHGAQRIQRVTDVFHHIIRRHQVEVEVWPARAELNFHDEKWTNPINTQIRFEAKVFNSREHVSWEVRNIAGSVGTGMIDASGLYRAPSKGGLASGTTEIVVATSTEDPLRKAFAWVTLIGEGPEPAPAPSVTIWPKRVNLYYRTGAHNAYIDDSNKMRMFSATLRDTPNTQIEWLVDGVPEPGTNPRFLYNGLPAGGGQVVTVLARIQGQPAIFDDAKVILLNYVWPGL